MVNMYFGKKTSVNRGRVNVSDLSWALEMMYKAERTKKIVKRKGNNKYREFNEENKTAIKSLLYTTLYGSNVRKKLRQLFFGRVSDRLYFVCLDGDCPSKEFNVCVTNPKSKLWTVAMAEQRFKKYLPEYRRITQETYTWAQLDQKTAANGDKNFIICENKLSDVDTPPYAIYRYREKFQEEFLDRIAEEFYKIYLGPFLEVFDRGKQAIEKNIQTRSGVGQFSPDHKIGEVFSNLTDSMKYWSTLLEQQTREIISKDGRKDI